MHHHFGVISGLLVLAACTVRESGGGVIGTAGSSVGGNAGSGNSGASSLGGSASGGSSGVSIGVGGALVDPGIGGASGREAIDPCAGLVLEPEPVEVEEEIETTITTEVPGPVAIYVMLDNSRSMDNDATPTKWQEAVTALTDFVNDPASEGIDIAIQYFHPEGVGDAPSECDGSGHSTPDVAMGRLPDNAPNIVASLGNTGPANSTPTVGALTGGVDFCAAFQADNLDEKCVVVLVTDGQPNGCGLSTGGPGQNNVDPNAISVLAPIAADGLAAGVTTFTIGMEGVSVDGFGLLNAIAVAGGSNCNPATPGNEACDVSTTGAAGFISALNAIRDSITVTETITETITTTATTVLPCEWAVPDPPRGETFAPDRVEVVVTSNDVATPIDHVTDADSCAAEGGWFYGYDAGGAESTIRVCPATCAVVEASMDTSVEVLFACEKVIP